MKPVYVVKQEYMENRVDLVSSIFDAAIEVHDQVQAMEKENLQEAQVEDEENPPVEEILLNEKVDMLKERLTETIVNDLSPSTLHALVNHSKNDLQIAKDATVTAGSKSYEHADSGNGSGKCEKKGGR